ncbi:hypothetical protein HS088_TW13G01282 [Tripterygium wilfordii]|uniref:Protein OBERON 4 n=1 Tax=Tripterygium wilfordii TaxID=458696 RepID=A0A7J7CWE2_TRIWF|nr:protein OBERON 4-like [Tripterygium wilfordii]XP_038719533.1 protein OBERON 4-like [Tripterygium wilfordii]KAF5738383.1 hypothetical protein HS088_TW13G01282 [Tripterygium wilfordii]
MKRLTSSDDLDSYSEKLASKESNPNRSSSSHRSFYYKSDNARKNLMSSSSSSGRYNRSGDDDDRPIRKRSNHEFDGFDRRKGFDRYSSCSRDGYSGDGGGGDRVIHRSESFSVPRREFPKGFRSERDRSRREGSVSSWRRFGYGGRGSDSKEFSAGSKELEERGGGSSGVRSPMGSRDMLKSPSWSRDSGSEQSKARGVWEWKGNESERERVKERSPTWSKDSGCEQSRSVEMKKTKVEWKGNSGISSEMEEGELEPEPKSSFQGCTDDENDNEIKGRKDDGLDADPSEAEDVQSELRVEETDKIVEGVEEETKEGDPFKMKDVVDDCDKVNEFEKNLDDESAGGHDDIGVATADAKEQEEEEDGLKQSNECKVEDNLKKSSDSLEETRNGTFADKSYDLEGESKQDKGIDLEAEVEMEDVEMPNSNEENATELEVNTNVASEGSEQNVKDKGKSVGVTPLRVVDYVEDNVWMGRESRDAIPFRDDDMEGPSTRGFELFSSSLVRRAEKADQAVDVKQRDDKLTLEPLDLSLSLPNVLLPIGASRDSNVAPSSPSHARSVQSLTNTFHTYSDGFTASMSFSGSQSFYHNPSCSLTQNSLDNYEQSVHSRPIFQGIDQLSQGAWQGLSQNDSRHKEVPLYQRILMNGNSSLQQSQPLQGISNGQPRQASSKMPNGLERQLSFHKQLSGGQPKYQDDVKSPSHSVGSHEIVSNYSFEKKRSVREKHSGNLYRTSSQKEQEQFLIGGAAFVETIISRIVSEPVHLMARKFHEMTGQSVSRLKESIREIMFSAEKHGQLDAVQNALQNRSDLTLEMLLKSHRSQLEILVALKTGLPEYLQLDSSVSSSDIAEIFLNLKCRNQSCRNPLPVDECDCKVCVKKNGFCSACMCLICSKFDMASNTCSWVGCDVCLHWCHVDCALRESFIRNGRSATGAQGTTEMQFHCVACDLPSEMFGFVKEVFLNFSKDWTMETFCEELEYVKRIFRGSKDVRGKRLHEIAHQILARLVANKSDLPEVYSNLMSFLTETDSSKFKDTTFSMKEQVKASNGIAGPSQDSGWLKSVRMEKAPQLERSGSLIPSHYDDRNEKRPLESELMRSIQKEPVFDELESVVRIKQAEAKMFQARADDARREAEGLKRIAIAKNEKTEEEYASRIAKLRLDESEETRKEKFEEFQALERAHREYFNMKMRMEADIKDLLMKMESTRRNFTM